MKKYIKPYTECNEVGGCMLMYTPSDSLGGGQQVAYQGDLIEEGTNGF